MQTSKRERTPTRIKLIGPFLVVLFAFHLVSNAQAQFARLKWSWTSSATIPTSLNVITTPGVIDLDLDGTPEIIFQSSASTSGSNCIQGHIRVLRGDDGSEVFTITSHLVEYHSMPALGDIDGDGYPEIIAVAPCVVTSGICIIAFEHTGAFKWRSPSIELGCGAMPSLADLYGDGTPEIIIGRQVLSNTGQILWTGTGGRGSVYLHFAATYAADIDLDGVLDIVAGNTVYRRDGTILWQAAIQDGYTVLLNADADSFPEIAHAENGRLRMLEHDGSLKWGPVSVPSAGYPGAPTIADFDGDGLPEIGISAVTQYTVFEPTGTVRWSASINDTSSWICSSSAFDFDGDGQAEIVHRDQGTLRIFNGLTGAALFSTPLGSGTLWEYPVVADVDGDGQADIVTGANQVAGATSPGKGLYVFESNGAPWSPARSIWNEYSYRIDNVNNLGHVPSKPNNGWLTHNSFRAQCSASSCPKPVPAISIWGLFVVALLLLIAGTITLNRHQHRVSR